VAVSTVSLTILLILLRLLTDSVATKSNDGASCPYAPPPFEADLALSKTVSPENVNVGDTVTFTLELSNKGPNTATGIELNDTLPDGYSFVDNSESYDDNGTGAQIGFDQSGSTLHWTVNALEINQTIRLSYDAVVQESGDHNNTALITASDMHDTNSTNDGDWAMPNFIPDPVDDNVTIAEDNGTLSGNLLEDDKDIDNDPLIVTQFEINGTVYGINPGESNTTTIPGVGTLTISSDGNFTFTPEPNYSGEVPSIIYTVEDSDGASDTAVLNITVTPVDDAPELVGGGLPDLENNDSDVITDLNLSGYFSDVDDEQSDLNFSVTGLPEGLSIDPDTGVISGTIAKDASQGGTDGDYNVTVTVTDPEGKSITTSFIWHIDNPAPVAQDDNVTMSEDNGTLEGNVISNSVSGGTLEQNGSDTDPDGDSLSIVNAGVDIDGDGLIDLNLTLGEDTDLTDAEGKSVGTIRLEEDGSYAFTPAEDYNGEVPSIIYTVEDSDGASDTAVLNITVEAVNDAPVAQDDEASTQEDTPVVIDVDSNDSDIDGDLDLSSLAIVAGSEPQHGNVTIDPDTGEITYTPEPNWNGTDTFTYQICDNGDPVLCDEANVTVTVEAVNDAPVALDNNRTVEEDTILTGNLITDDDGQGVDSDADGDVLNVVGFSVDSDGDGVPESFEANETVIIEGVGSITVDKDGNYTLIPEENFNGKVPSVEYTISDGNGGLDSALLEITVKPVTDPISDEDETLSMLEDHNISGSLLENLNDADSDEHRVVELMIDIDGDGVAEDLSERLGEALVLTDEDGTPIATVTIEENGEYSVVPEEGYYGSLPTVTYVVEDVNDPDDRDSSTLQITVLQDSDSDGIPDSEDIDDDNDGIPDVVEEAGDPDRDTDGDGIPDRLDLDSDNDGILDIIEAGGVDSDGDGRVDDPTDRDGDGLADSVDSHPDDVDNPADKTEGLEATTLPVSDTDSDGTPDFQDVDSDNDGISDLIEGGTEAALDSDNDGMIDPQSDENSDGTPDNVDENGIAAGIPDRSAEQVPDTDSDGVADYRDLDSDNDGIDDLIEAGGSDADGDGLVDHPGTLVGERLPDSDGDGIPDVLEPDNSGLPSSLDENGDGVIDDTTDSDGDGIPDVTDGSPESFGDYSLVDTDEDGVEDTQDIDDDNDGIPDVIEEAGDPDRDTDGDGIPDRLDLDSDNDGILDILEAGGIDNDGNGRVDDSTDSDGDGLADMLDSNPNDVDNPQNADEGHDTTKLPVPDTDSDGTPDFQDLDSDNDGISDLFEGGTDPALDSDNDGMIDPQTDENGDGTPDNVDENGIAVGIPDRTAFIGEEGYDANGLPNVDGDALPNYRDLDSDNDGLSDVREANGPDSDPQDGIIDTPEELIAPETIPDQDGDGILDPYEPNNPDLPDSLDQDGDGMIDDTIDSDGDNDGIPDIVDGEDDDYGTEIIIQAQDDRVEVTGLGGTVIDILADDRFTILSKIEYEQPEHGELFLDDRGTPDPNDDVLVYIPEADYEGTVEFTYVLTDAFGNKSEAKVTLEVCNSSQPSDGGGGSALGWWSVLVSLLGLLWVGASLLRRNELT